MAEHGREGESPTGGRFFEQRDPEHLEGEVDGLERVPEVVVEVEQALVDLDQVQPDQHKLHSSLDAPQPVSHPGARDRAAHELERLLEALLAGVEVPSEELCLSQLLVQARPLLQRHRVAHGLSMEGAFEPVDRLDVCAVAESFGSRAGHVAQRSVPYLGLLAVLS
eukprot:755474-Hanusia_phi.AAC.2